VESKDMAQVVRFWVLSPLALAWATSAVDLGPEELASIMDLDGACGADDEASAVSLRELGSRVSKTTTAASEDRSEEAAASWTMPSVADTGLVELAAVLDQDACGSEDESGISLQQLRGSLSTTPTSEDIVEDMDARISEARAVDGSVEEQSRVEADALSARRMMGRAHQTPLSSSMDASMDASLGRKPPRGVVTLYHQTSPEIAALILKGGFRPGHAGWCGGGIYFATTPEATKKKAIGTNSHLGFIIEAKVNLGRVLQMPASCDQRMNGRKLHRMGFNSIYFDPGDGPEVVVYSNHRVLSTRPYFSAAPWEM